MREKTISNIIFKVIDSINEDLPPERRLSKTAETKLYGKEGHLDSLGLVRMIVAIEQEIQEEFNVTLILADEKAMSQTRSPFQTVETLSRYIDSLLSQVQV